MLKAGPALKVTVYLNQDTGSTKGFLYEDVLRFLQEHGIKGATAIRAYAGFGAGERLRRADSGDIEGEHLPIVISLVDETVKVRAILPELLTIVTDGLVEAHSTEVLKDISKEEGILT
jgi:PII-like signaling protein